MSDAFADLPEDWVVWNDEPEGRAVLVYRPDVFDSQAHPPECLPTIHVGRRHPDQGPPRRLGRPPGDGWHVAVYLEPEVRVRDLDASVDSRAAAVDAAVAAARAFAAGEVDYRAAYQVPRESYFEALDDLTGRSPETDDATDR